MKPSVEKFQDDTELVNEVQELLQKGVNKDNVYVLAHDKDRTNRIADKVDVNEIGMKEEGLKEAVQNIFRKEGDELRTKLSEVGFSKEEASDLEENLDQGKILLIVTDNQ